jgi:predicted small metal-binding protein
MKTMTCRDLGGACDQKLSANSWDEMVQKMSKHVMEKHPDVAKEMEKMHNENPTEVEPRNEAEVRQHAGTPISYELIERKSIRPRGKGTSEGDLRSF